MDTKWKNIISFASFFCGASLFIGSVLNAGAGWANGWYNAYNLNNISEDDYQNTDSFQSYMESSLENFLVIGTGGYPGWYGYSYDSDISISESIAEDTVTEGYVAEEIETWEKIQQDYPGVWPGSSEGYGYHFSYDEEPFSEEQKEENKKEAERFHSYLQEDKNLLYTVTSGGKVLYSNCQGFPLDGPSRTLPEGYNFLLYFDGSKVSIVKDGNELDVYGDGYYEENESWYVPGYKNFLADDEMNDVTVCLAAAKEPVLYAKVKSSYGYQQPANKLYWIQHDAKLERKFITQNAVTLAAALLLLLAACFTRRYRKTAKQGIARFTGKIWFEGKVFLFALAIFYVLYVMFLCIERRYGSWSDITYIFYESAMEGGWYLNDFIRTLLSCFFASGLIAATELAFWCTYLFCNDMRWNKKEWQHSIAYRVCQAYSSKAFHYPPAKRLLSRSCILLAAMLSAYTLLSLVILAVTGWLFDYPEISVPVYALGVLLITGIQLLNLNWLKKSAEDMELLSDRISAIHKGDYHSQGKCSKDSSLNHTIAKLDDIRKGMDEAVEERLKSERMKVELVANVSHDIKTPLTSIISYVQLMKEEPDLPEHMKDYIRILDEKSQRLKNMVQDVFSVSKAASGQLPVTMEILDFGKLLRQTLADMSAQIEGSAVTLRTDLPQEPVLIKADGERLYRVFQNLLQNALKYSLEGSRIYLTLKEDGSMAVASVKNTSRTEINSSVDFAERFTRGDVSRTDGGSGLGLSIAQSFTEACQGSFQLETIADLFVVTVTFAKAEA